MSDGGWPLVGARGRGAEQEQRDEPGDEEEGEGRAGTQAAQGRHLQQGDI